MTNNNTRGTEDFGNEIPGGGNRKHISAAEVELFDDISPLYETAIRSAEDSTPSRARVLEQQILPSSINNQKQSNHHHLSSHSREPLKPNIAHQVRSEEQLNSAIDKLLEKYAPE